MPALLRTDFTATITYLGRVERRDSGLSSHPIASMTLGFAGPEGEDHGGLTRPSCSRVTAQYPRGTTIRNTRQLSILSQEEIAQIAKAMGLDALEPAWFGASIVLSGLPDFTHVPPGSRLQAEDAQGQGGATLVVDMQNRPCTLVAREIETHRPGFGAAFKPAAKELRGVTAWVEREGVLALGQTLRLHIPDQPVWACLDQARKGAGSEALTKA